MRTERWTGAAGLVLVVLVLTGVVAETMGPNSSMAAAEMAASFKSAQGTVLVGSAILLGQHIVFALFAAGLAALAARSGKDRALSGLILLSAGLGVSLSMVYVATYSAVATVVNELPIPVVFGIFTVGDTMDIAGSAFIGVMVAAGAYGLARSELSPRWQAGVGLAAGGVMVIASFGILAPQSSLLQVPLLVGILLTLVWIVVASIRLIRRSATETPG